MSILPKLFPARCSRRWPSYFRRLAPRPRAGATCTLSADSRRCAKDAQIRAEENIKQISLSKMLMLIEERRQRQHSLTFDERLTYEDTDPNFRHNIHNVYPPPPVPCPVRRKRSAARGVRGGCHSPCPCHRRRRASSAHSRTHSHMLIGTCQTAQPLLGCRAARSRIFTPSPLTSA